MAEAEEQEQEEQQQVGHPPPAAAAAAYDCCGAGSFSFPFLDCRFASRSTSARAPSDRRSRSDPLPQKDDLCLDPHLEHLALALVQF